MSQHQTCLHPASHVLVLLEFVATNNCFLAWKLCRDKVFSVAAVDPRFSTRASPLDGETRFFVLLENH